MAVGSANLSGYREREIPRVKIETVLLKQTISHVFKADQGWIMAAEG